MKIHVSMVEHAQVVFAFAVLISKESAVNMVIYSFYFPMLMNFYMIRDKSIKNNLIPPLLT